MIISLSWRPADHILLQGVSFTMLEDGVAVPTVLAPGRASVEVSDVADTLQLTLTFKPTVGSQAEVLRIEQFLKRSPLSSGAFPIFEPLQYVVLTGQARRRRVIPGRHPLLRGAPPALIVNTSLVDVTGLIPVFTDQMAKMAPRRSGALASEPRIFARTDETLPQIWIVATPHVCRGNAATDVICFFGPNQNHKVPPTLIDQLTVPATTAALVAHGAVMLGGGTPDGGGIGAPRLMDHFTPGNTILARGFEAALVASGRHALIAIPVPANKSHNKGATAALPGLLADVRALTVAVGDAHPPLLTGDLERTEAWTTKPKYALAAHSSGGTAIWGEPDPGHESEHSHAPTTQRPGALAAGPDAYSDLILIEGLFVADRLDKLARSGGARVIFNGYDPNTTSLPFSKALTMPSLAARVSRLPVRSPGDTPPESASLDELAAHSASLTLALTGLPTKPSGSEELFLLKHQLCAWSGDDGGVLGKPEVHFLTQALNLSSLR